MATLSSESANRAIRYQSLGNFYSADSRRRVSPELDVGLWWRAGAHGPVYRAAWVRETGELYVTRLGPPRGGKCQVVVLGRAERRNDLERVLEGWRDACPQPDSMTWLRHRAARLAAPERPAQAPARAPDSDVSGPAAARVSNRRRQGARGLRPSDAAAERPERGCIARDLSA
jgi:hypothetical protein